MSYERDVGMPPLHIAAVNGHLALVSTLLMKDEKSIHSKKSKVSTGRFFYYFSDRYPIKDKKVSIAFSYFF